MGGGEGGVRLANIKFLITHNLMQKNGSALLEAMDGASPPRGEGKEWAGRYLLYLEMDLPKL